MERILKQFGHLREMQEAIWKAVRPACEALEKALGPAFAAQEHWRHIAESARLLQIHLPDLSPIVKQVSDFQKLFLELPARTQEALLVLGQHGWYMDQEMPLSSLWELKGALSEGNIAEAETALVEYFEERLSEIEASITRRFPHRSHLINSAFGAHRREEYVLSIPVLLAQVDGICKETVDQYLFIGREKKPSTAVYVARIAADTYMAALLSPLAESLPISATKTERPEGFSELNRHTVLHGESLDYGSEVNSLKAISLVNYVAHALPADNDKAQGAGGGFIAGGSPGAAGSASGGSKKGTEMDIQKLEARLLNIMRHVNDIERATGVGGAAAEIVQEQCNAIARDAGSRLRFGLGGENPTTPNP